MSIDVAADVEALAVFERQAQAFREAMEATWPRLKRLRDADYAGALDCGWPETEEGLDWLLQSLENLRLAKGRPEVSDYVFFVKHGGLTLEQAAKELIDLSDDGLARVEPMRLYAATVSA